MLTHQTHHKIVSVRIKKPKDMPIFPHTQKQVYYNRITKFQRKNKEPNGNCAAFFQVSVAC